MEIKDWILLLVPVLLNGISVFVFQKIIGNKIDNMKKRDLLRDEIILLFWKKLQELNDTFLETNVKVSRNLQTLNEGLETIRDKVFGLVQYYDKNKYDLNIFEKEYSSWEDSWNTFVSTLVEYNNCELTDEQKIKLGNQLQCVKDKIQVLIETTRQRY